MLISSVKSAPNSLDEKLLLIIYFKQSISSDNCSNIMIDPFEIYLRIGLFTQIERLGDY